MDEIENKLNTIKNVVDNYPAGKVDQWDLDELDGDLDFIYGLVEELEELLEIG